MNESVVEGGNKPIFSAIGLDSQGCMAIGAMEGALGEARVQS